ncbi:MAG: N-acetylmuramoyl-L-alanine amidase, partial [Clostridium perfringens]|nr:N-acetylmuramoyl-L-alanine amidase [Clostridium perfringens]
EPYCENEPNKANKDITIVIDPGHSSTISNETEPECPGSQKRKLKDTLGATGVQSKIPEYTITHGVAKELKKLLISEGYNVIMTKDSPDKQLSNIERTTIGNDNNANLIIRIHCDGVDSPKACGASILVPATKGNVTKDISDISYSYGEKILTAYTKYTGLKNRGVVVRDDLTGFNWSKVPIVLIELGFISNPNEDSYLSNPDNYIKIVTGISNGINYCFAK